MPELCGPLYSLHKHGQMSDCEMISHYDEGTYALFPTFALQIDNLRDNVVSYRSIRCRDSGPINSAKPRLASTRPS